MTDYPDVMFLPYQPTLDLLTVEDAMRLCEDVFRMHARGTVDWSNPPNFRLDTPAPLHNHWHVKAVLLREIPITGVRLYNYFDDGQYNNVGYLDCTRYIVLSDPATGHALAIVDEHWLYAIRSAAAAVIPCKWLAAPAPKVLALVGCGTMGVNSLRCLETLYDFDEIRVTSRRPETREAFARDWSEKLGRRVVAVSGPEEAARGADIVVGATTSSDVISRADWLKPGCTFISLARRELDPADWHRMDKIVIDDWVLNYNQRFFREMVDRGQFSRDRLHGEIHEVVSGAKSGRTDPQERILIHTNGLVSQDVALAHFLFERAKAEGLGMMLPAARAKSI